MNLARKNAKGGGRLSGVVAALGVAVSAAVLAACGGGTAANTSSSGAPSAAPASSAAEPSAAAGSSAASESGNAPKVDLVTLVYDQKAGDGAVTDSQLAGLKTVGEQLGAETRAVYVGDPANYQSTLEDAVAAGSDIVVTSFLRISEAFNTVAKAHPDVKFVHLYALPEEGYTNLLTALFQSQDVFYVSGVFGGSLSDTGKLGFIGGEPLPSIEADYQAYAAGAASVNPESSVEKAFVGNWDDAAKGNQIATQMYGAGVDVIQTDAGGADGGIVEAAKKGEGTYVTPGQVSLMTGAPKVAFGTADFDYGAWLIELVTYAASPEFEPGAVFTGLGPAMSFRFTDEPPTDAALLERFNKAKANAEAAQQGIIDGTVTVPSA